MNQVPNVQIAYSYGCEAGFPNGMERKFHSSEARMVADRSRLYAAAGAKVVLYDMRKVRDCDTGEETSHRSNDRSI